MAGAQVIYGRMFGALINSAFPTMIVRYPDIVTNPLGAAMKLAQFAGLGVDRHTIKRAANCTRSPAPQSK
jgi:hypothetical protein